MIGKVGTRKTKVAKFLRLMLTDAEVCRDFCSRGISNADIVSQVVHRENGDGKPDEVDDVHILLDMIRDQWERSKTLLTRDGLLLRIEPLKLPKLDAIRIESLYHSAAREAAQPADYHELLEYILKARRNEHLGGGLRCMEEFLRTGSQEAYAKAQDHFDKANPDRPTPQPTAPVQPLAFDLARLPSRLARGIAGLGRANPLLPLSAQVLLPAAWAGAIIGKRMRCENHGAIYYPNLWTVSVAPTNSNKSGTRNIVLKATPVGLQLPDSPTMEALIDRLGRSIKAKDKAETSAARAAAIAEDEGNLDGGIIIADEVTGTLKKLLGSDGRNADRNIEDVLKLATSTERVEQPRVGTGYRIAADLCVSVVGFTQPDTWETMFGADRYRSNGFVGRIVPCADGIQLVNVPDVPRDEWAAFTAAVQDTGTWSVGADRRTIDFGVTDTVDPIREVMAQVMRTEAWRVLAETVGDYADRLRGKVIGHGLKLAMVCQWCCKDFESAAHWLPACLELVTVCYANYFRSTFAARVGLTAQEQAAVAYIRANPGRTVNDLRKKFHLRDNREAGQLAGSLLEAGAVSTRPGKRKDSVTLWAA